jgi:hypothetical protein
MKINAIQTGTVAITTKWREGAGRGRRRLMNMLLDREWTEPLPIYAFAIEHPEGVVVVDTGETARVSEPGYFPRWQPFFRFAVRERVEPEQEIGPPARAARHLAVRCPARRDDPISTPIARAVCTTSRTTRSLSRGASLTTRQDCVGAFAATQTSAGPPGFARPSSTYRRFRSAPSQPACR